MAEIIHPHKTIAIMQPYFLPYAGYFRLLAGADLFVIYDCVQFQRRGWMHRNQLLLASGEPDWLTMPLEKASRDVLIRDLRFRPDAHDSILAQARRFPALNAGSGPMERLARAIGDVRGRPVDYIVSLMEIVADILDIPWRVARSTDLALPSALKGQDRILAIAKAFDATRYLNAPGGRELYDRGAFAAAGIELCFLSDHAGAYSSIAQRLADEDPLEVSRHIRAGVSYLP